MTDIIDFANEALKALQEKADCCGCDAGGERFEKALHNFGMKVIDHPTDKYVQIVVKLG